MEWTGAAVTAVGDAAAEVAGSRQAQGSMDQRFAMKISDMNNFEIQAGKLAQQKAQRDDIKELAQMTVEDHTQAQQQLQPIAQKMGVSTSDQLRPVHQAMLTELSQMEGKEFDRAYLYGQVAGHTKASLKLRDAQTELQDPQLRQYAATISPKIRQHLQHAQKLANADEAMTAGARIQGGAHDAAGHGATDALRPANEASDVTGSTGGGRPARGAAPEKGVDAPAGPSAPGNESK